jgi:hypothetical protein
VTILSSGHRACCRSAGFSHMQAGLGLLLLVRPQAGEQCLRLTAKIIPQ